MSCVETGVFLEAFTGSANGQDLPRVDPKSRNENDDTPVVPPPQIPCLNFDRNNTRGVLEDVV